MGQFFERVRRGSIDGPRKRAFSLDKWEKAFNVDKPHDDADDALYKAGVCIHDKLHAIRLALSKSSLSRLSRETRVKAFVAAVNHEYESLLTKAREAASPKEGQSNLDAYDLTKVRVTTADGQSYGVESILATVLDGVTIPLRFSLTGRSNDVDDNFSNVTWEDVVLELNLGAIYDQAEGIWEDCVWNNYVLKGNSQNIIVVPTEMDAKRGAHAATARKTVLAMEAITYAIQAIQQIHKKGVAARLRSVKAVLNDRHRQRIELGTDEMDPRSQAMLFALQTMACPPYFESLIDDPQARLSGLSISQLFDGWIIVSQAARLLWEETTESRHATITGGLSDMTKYLPSFTKAALSEALQSAARLSPSGAHTIIEFLTFRGNAKQQLWSQPLIAVGDETKLFPIFGAIASPPNLRFVLELWMAQLDVPFGKKGEPFEKYLRQSIADAISNSPLLYTIAKTIPNDFTFKCKDGSFGQLDALFCVGSQIFVVEAKCILEPTDSTSIGTHRQTVEEAAYQAKKRIELINEHRSEFIDSMKVFGWDLAEDFVAHPLIVVSTVAHVGVSCDGVPVVDELVVERFFAGSFEKVGVDTKDFSIVKRVRYPFYATANEAESVAATYFASPPQLRQYLEGLTLTKTPVYAVSDEDWGGIVLEFAHA